MYSKLTKRMYYILLLTAVIFSSSCKKSGDSEPKEEEEETIVTQQDIAIVDNAVKAYMDKYNVPGLSLAITKDEKLVYAKAYGKADIESNQNVDVNSKFRIASVSKPVTSIAVMKLIQEGKLSINQKVFGAGALLGTDYGSKAYTANMLNITVRHLLNHTAGGWGNQSNDPMFTNPTMTTTQLISWTLDNIALKQAPGLLYDYSNFGYCLLGRIIEKVTGKPYADYMQDAIFKPSGVTGMVMGGNTLADRKAGEVKYYGTATSGPDPYAYNIARMDAHGGWISSATDMVRLMVHADGFAEKQDVINTTSIATMTTVPSLATASGYACGWGVNGNLWWHMGSLPGTVSELARNGDRKMNGAILVNKRDSGAFESSLDVLLWNSILRNTSIVWQDIDQF